MKFFQFILVNAFLSVLLFSQGKKHYDIPFGQNSKVGQFLDVENSEIYYEIYGKKKNPPLVLIHGNGGSISAMKYQISHFMKDYFVIVADNRTHGKSGNSKKLSYEQMANDYIAIINQLSLDSVYVLGQSDGGIIGLLMAINYPDYTRKLVSAVPNIVPGKEAVVDWELEFSKKYRSLVDSMIAIKDTSRNWEVENIHMNLMATEPQIKVEELGKISCPVLIMTSDDDIIRPRHILNIFDNIPKAQMFMMPGATHFMIRDEYKLFNLIAERFLSEPFKRPKSKEALMELIGIE